MHAVTNSRWVAIQDQADGLVEIGVFDPFNGFALAVQIISKGNKLKDCSFNIRFKAALAAAGLAV